PARCLAVSPCIQSSQQVGRAISRCCSQQGSLVSSPGHTHAAVWTRRSQRRSERLSNLVYVRISTQALSQDSYSEAAGRTFESSTGLPGSSVAGAPRVRSV